MNIPRSGVKEPGPLRKVFIMVHLESNNFGDLSRQTVPSELNHISAWAINNNLKLNVNKSRELSKHGRARFDLLYPIPDVSRVEVLPVLGFVLSGDLSVGHHLTETLSSCSRSL